MQSSLKKRRPLQRHQVTLAGEQLEARQLLDTQGISYAVSWGDEGAVRGDRSHHDDDGLISVSTLAPGQQLFVFKGLGERDDGKHVQVSQFSNSFSPGRTCSVVYWKSSAVGDLEVRVHCDTSARNYTVAVVERDNNLGAVFAWAGRPTDASYTADRFYENNPSGDVQITRMGVGHYQARFVGRGGTPTPGGNVQITPYGNEPRLAFVNRWFSDNGDMLVDYSITTTNGTPADGAASIMVIPFGAQPDTVAYGWSKAGGSDEDLIASGYAYNPTGAGITKERRSAGNYRVTFEGFGSNFGFYSVTPYGQSDHSCSVYSIIDAPTLGVACEDASGNLSDSNFSVFVTKGNEPMYDLVADIYEQDRPLGNHDYAVFLLSYLSPVRRTGNFVVTPMTRGEPSPNAIVLVSPSAQVNMSPGFYQTGPFVSFTISAGSVHVDQVRVEMWSAGNRELLFSGYYSADFSFAPSSSVGDLDANGMIDEDDIRMICEDRSRGDLNRDQTLDLSDLDILIRDILATSYGDANLDGSFETSDLTQIFAAGKYESAAHASWSEGDWNCDGRFDSSDLVRALADGAYERRSPIVDLAARQIEANILRSISPFVAEIAVVGYVRNVGTLDYQSNPTQQVARLYEINPGGAPRLVASQPFANLAPGQEIAVRYTRLWDRSSPAEGEFPPTYRLVIEFDPDIAFDGNPLNDDRVQPNNATEMLGTQINDLFG